MIHRIAILSEVIPQWFDCCVNSCIAYTGKYKDDQQCPFRNCQEPRRSPGGVARRLFCYLPMIPRFKGFFQSKRMINELLYRHQYVSVPGTIADVFDGEIYQELLSKYVVVGGETLSHKYFSGKHDIAFSIALDGYLLYKRRRGGPSATPIIIQIFNLPPAVRTHVQQLMILGVIPGPHGPKRPETFLAPVDDECAELAHGVSVFNCVDQNNFTLHAYNLFNQGDIVSIEKVLGIKGHNGLSPCRSCEITGVYNKVYYVPLCQPSNPGEELETWDPKDLPMRKHEDWQNVVDEINAAHLKKDKGWIAMKTGIKRMPALTRVRSLDYARSNPWDWTHLFLENVIPNLVDLWMGRFKGLDSGNEDYEIDSETWKLIGDEGVEAVKNLPAPFTRVIPHIVKERGWFTAEAWCFWFIYLAPILLNGRFSDHKYYDHMCDLVVIMKICLQFSITQDEVDDLEDKIITWVCTYEAYV